MSDVRIDMAGRVALVTGGGYGMGRASARRFAECGARVVVADIDAARAAETVEVIAAAGGEAAAFHVDVGEAEGVREMVDFTVATYGGLDSAHNNAGIIEAQDAVTDFSEALWEKIIRTNLTSVFLCLKYEIPRMLERGGGAIVNVASETTYKGNVGDVAYTASKHGVVGLTTVAGLRYAKRGVRVNAIAPGNVETGITERAREFLTPQQARAMETAQPIGRIAQPEEIAELVVWLCSDAAVLVNATRIAADTGWHVA
ncbi:SDR family NAD(P)-dependent oxidoreductase [Trujillonella humicola]|uniref:SDR family NAD(P)-dependent oxidoreductase n=1 Tax=Trujillonella humicola TaxID=3383699 RepID=UPI003906678E